MNIEHLDAIITRQSELIAALDAQDAAAITGATEALAAAVSLVKNAPIHHRETDLPDRIGDVLRQNQAAAIRVNYLMHWTRQRIGKIAELRGTPLDRCSVNYRI